MEFKHIEYFVEACRRKSITQAASELYISQQALSRCIANMEFELGCELFRRTSKGILLTDEGKYLLGKFQPLVTEFHNTLDEISIHFDRMSPKLTFACAPLVLGVLDPGLLFSFQNAYPNTSLHMLELPDADFETYVQYDDRHFGLIAMPEHWLGQKLDYRLLKTLPLYLYVHKDHPLAQKERVNFEMLKQENFLMLDKKSYYREVLYAHTDPHGYHPQPIFESADVNHICSLVNAGQGIFLATENPATNKLFQNIVMIPFEEESLNYSIAVVFRNYERLGSAVKKFINFILKYTA